jgi:crossover junction endodeoxyribonuclease RuvC
MKVILGIDPGSQVTGFGVVQCEGGQIWHMSHGVIVAPAKLTFHQRLGIIASELEILFAKIKPDITVIERIFLGKNADSAFKLGHARGLAVANAARAESEIIEYATRSIKKGVTGNGGATKEQVQLVLFSLLGIKGAAPADASDALALAYHHAQTIRVDENFYQQKRRLAPEGIP